MQAHVCPTSTPAQHSTTAISARPLVFYGYIVLNMVISGWPVDKTRLCACTRELYLIECMRCGAGRSQQISLAFGAWWWPDGECAETRSSVRALCRIKLAVTSPRCCHGGGVLQINLIIWARDFSRTAFIEIRIRKLKVDLA